MSAKENEALIRVVVGTIFKDLPYGSVSGILDTVMNDPTIKGTYLTDAAASDPVPGSADPRQGSMSIDPFAGESHARRLAREYHERKYGVAAK